MPTKAGDTTPTAAADDGAWDEQMTAKQNGEGAPPGPEEGPGRSSGHARSNRAKAKENHRTAGIIEDKKANAILQRMQALRQRQGVAPDVGSSETDNHGSDSGSDARPSGSDKQAAVDLQWEWQHIAAVVCVSCGFLLLFYAAHKRRNLQVVQANKQLSNLQERLRRVDEGVQAEAAAGTTTFDSLVAHAQHLQKAVEAVDSVICNRGDEAMQAAVKEVRSHALSLLENVLRTAYPLAKDNGEQLQALLRFTTHADLKDLREMIDAREAVLLDKAAVSDLRQRAAATTDPSKRLSLLNQSLRRATQAQLLHEADDVIRETTTREKDVFFNEMHRLLGRTDGEGHRALGSGSGGVAHGGGQGSGGGGVAHGGGQGSGGGGHVHGDAGGSDGDQPTIEEISDEEDEEDVESIHTRSADGVAFDGTESTTTTTTHAETHAVAVSHKSHTTNASSSSSSGGGGGGGYGGGVLRGDQLIGIVQTMTRDGASQLEVEQVAARLRQLAQQQADFVLELWKSHQEQQRHAEDLKQRAEEHRSRYEQEERRMQRRQEEVQAKLAAKLNRMRAEIRATHKQEVEAQQARMRTTHHQHVVRIAYLQLVIAVAVYIISSWNHWFAQQQANASACPAHPLHHAGTTSYVRAAYRMLGDPDILTNVIADVIKLVICNTIITCKGYASLVLALALLIGNAATLVLFGTKLASVTLMATAAVITLLYGLAIVQHLIIPLAIAFALDTVWWFVHEWLLSQGVSRALHHIDTEAITAVSRAFAHMEWRVPGSATNWYHLINDMLVPGASIAVMLAVLLLQPRIA
ncbi:hypothetical protein PTSG_02468 [Salpingoeca rosetta]|uniref:Transmembrane protein n=1 Tax=Salpingoeca rosetta (strain ATCC 50818 / BSB-021) TaxID=946362 RepID=F2U2A4_SALR5|nr:uncharacterized protein PTSG_02468 [Salpingoeca rosetta]EGD81756.1 hypothetical protein PTSG_02468 [Salpingoeca rosetta]|eukprot:XP_004996960.1 hypothetical protein PTSG_02468 [Salpingoeca rosetta]